MKWRNIWAIAKKDWLEVRQNKAALIPMAIVPLIFIVILPLLVTLILPAFEVDAQDVINSDEDLKFFIERMPPELSRNINLESPIESMIVMVMGLMMAPMFLILPLMFATIIASESFAGERERKTIEALLYTPASDAELLTGKVMAAFIPSLLATWLGFLVYTLILNLAPYSHFQRFWFPLPTWWLLIFWITPAVVLLAIALTVIISARAQTFMGAYQSSAVVVLLVVVLFGGQLSGVLYLSMAVEWALGAIFFLAAALTGFYAVRTFSRTALLASPRE